MRTLTRENLLDILYGCTILGTGGGGSLEKGIAMIDEALAPPKGFRMFFDPNGKGMNRYPASMGKVESPESAFDGAVYIQCGDWRFEHRVPIRMDPTRFPVSVHLLDVVRAAGTPVPDGLETFLGNFDFFATNVGKLYTDAHKRRY